MARKTDITWKDLRVATDQFIAKAVKNGPDDNGKEHGFGPDELDMLLAACEPTKLFRSAPMRHGYERSQKAIKNKKTGRWGHLAYLTTWNGLKAEYEKNELNCPLARWWESAREAVDEEGASWEFVKVQGNTDDKVTFVYKKTDNDGEKDVSVHMRKEGDDWFVDAAGGAF